METKEIKITRLDVPEGCLINVEIGSVFVDVTFKDVKEGTFSLRFKPKDFVFLKEKIQYTVRRINDLNRRMARKQENGKKTS